MPKPPTLPAPKPRVSQKIRDAIRYRVREGLSVKAAAEKADLSRNGLAKALKRPHVRELLEKEMKSFVLESEGLRASYKAMALEHAMHLAKNAKSETVQARMIEFLASEPKSSHLEVKIDTAPQHPIGYAYLKPGQKAVQIVSQEEQSEPKSIVRFMDDK